MHSSARKHPGDSTSSYFGCPKTLGIPSQRLRGAEWETLGNTPNLRGCKKYKHQALVGKNPGFVIDVPKSVSTGVQSHHPQTNVFFSHRYVEAIGLLYAPIVFELSKLTTMHRFLTVPTYSLEHIQSLDMGWAVRGFCTYQRPGTEGFSPEGYSPENHTKWIEVCLAIKEMRGMKYLRIRIYRLWAMRLMERELLDPLTGPLPGLSIEREDFIVELPKRVAGDQDCHLMDEDSSESNRFSIIRT